MTGFLGGLFSGGKYEKELSDLQARAVQNPLNIHLRVRVGDLLERMGKREEALDAYRRASEQYARKGFLIQAIAVNKLILRLDPAQTHIQENLAGLYSQWGLGGERKEEMKGFVPGAPETGERKFPVIPLFSDLKKEEFLRVMEKIQVRRFPGKSAICREGESGNSIFIISRGSVRIVRRTAPGKDLEVNRLPEGDFFGEFGFFSNSRRTATVEALEETEVLEISKPDFEDIIREFPAVAQVLVKFYRERVLDSLFVRSPVFQTFSAEERRQVLNRVTMESFPAGAAVLQEGAPGDCLYIIKQGEVEVFTTDPKLGRVSLARLKEGDFFGEISLLTGRPRSASVTALQPAELVRLKKQDYDQIAARHPQIVQILEDSLQARLENKLRALGIFQNNPAKEEMV